MVLVLAMAPWPRCQEEERPPDLPREVRPDAKAVDQETRPHDRVSRILGKKVVNPGKEDLGEIDDLILTKDGGITYAVLSKRGGRLVPWVRIAGEAGKRLVLDMSEDRLEDAPHLDEEDWSDPSSPKWEKIDSWFGVKLNQERTFGGRASVLRRAAIKDPAGRKVAKVEDLIIDVALGRVTMAVLDGEKELGLEGRLVVIPWDAMTVAPLRTEFAMKDDLPALTLAPRFERTTWPEIDQAYVTKVHLYFRRDPDRSAPVIIIEKKNGR